MAEPRPDPTGDSTTTPVWLRAFGIVALLVVVLFVVVMIVGGGGHAPPPGLHGPPP